MKVEFIKPVISELRKKGYMIADMHFHTEYSDGKARVQDLIKQLEKNEFHCAITDHESIGGVNYAKKSDRIIPGLEISSRNSKDILFYFYDHKELNEFYNSLNLISYPGLIHKSNQDFIELFEISQDYNCITSAAHPFGYQWKNISKYLEKETPKSMKNFEVINSGLTRSRNISALNHAKDNDLGMTAGSDGHSIYDLGRAVTYSYASDKDEFLDNIRKKQNHCIGTEIPFFKIPFFTNMIRNKITNFLNN